MSENRELKSFHIFKKWSKIGFYHAEVMEGYLRISDHELDIPGAKIILIDSVGNFKGYTLYENHDGELVEVALEFSEDMSYALYNTWKWLKVEWVK